MPKTEAQKRATAKYDAAHYDQLKILVRKGTRAEWQASAAAEGRSLAGYIVNAVEEHEQGKQLSVQSDTE